jgi:hypothetical protein
MHFNFYQRSAITSLKGGTQMTNNDKISHIIFQLSNKVKSIKLWSYCVPFIEIFDKFIDTIRITIAQNFFPYSYKEVSLKVSFNRILDNRARMEYKPIIEQMQLYLPHMMKRKIPEANVQQAFVLDTVYKHIKNKPHPKILCVGSYEDTASASLKMMGYHIEEIDPLLNYDLDTYVHLPKTIKANFDVVFSTSVIEHVSDDETFISQIVELMAPNGICILTCDYNNNYRLGDKLPRTGLRFYTKDDFTKRLIPCLKGCVLIDDPKWDEFQPDFIYDGCPYSFATITFKKELRNF